MKLVTPLPPITYPLQPRRGFTMVEMILVMTIFVVTVASTLPLLSAYKQQQTLPSLTTELLQVLRRAQGRSLAGTSGLPWGISIKRDDVEADTFTMFAGNLSEQYERYQETHEAARPFRLCTDKPDGTIVFPADINIEHNQMYFIEIYSEDDDFDKTFILINTNGTVEQVKTYDRTCRPSE